MKKLFLSAALLALGTGITFAQSTTQDTTKKTMSPATTTTTMPATTTETTTSPAVQTETTVQTKENKQPAANDPKATKKEKKKDKRKIE